MKASAALFVEGSPCEALAGARGQPGALPLTYFMLLMVGRKLICGALIAVVLSMAVAACTCTWLAEFCDTTCNRRTAKQVRSSPCSGSPVGFGEYVQVGLLCRHSPIHVNGEELSPCGHLSKASSGPSHVRFHVKSPDGIPTGSVCGWHALVAGGVTSPALGVDAAAVDCARATTAPWASSTSVAILSTVLVIGRRPDW